jgi:hypothetical protein
MSSAARKPLPVREVRLWAVDTTTEEFRVQLAADLAAMRSNPDDEASDWLDTVAADMEAMIEAEETGSAK